MSSIFSIPSGLPPSTADVTRMYYKYKQNNNDKLKAETFWDEAEYKFESLVLRHSSGFQDGVISSYKYL